MSQINIQYHATVFGELMLGSFDGKLCMCDWRYRKMRTSVDSRLEKGLNVCYVESDDEVLRTARQQLTDYFNAKRKRFDIPLLLVGTDFQKQVWRALMDIPFGRTISYLQLAENIGNIKAVRAVASANGANAISILVPCHRVVGANGDLVGYAGGLRAKAKLLTLEQRLLAL